MFEQKRRTKAHFDFSVFPKNYIGRDYIVVTNFTNKRKAEKKVITSGVNGRRNMKALGGSLGKATSMP